MDFSNYNIGSCNPTQILNINFPINNVDQIDIYNECNEAYDKNSLLYSYSVDSVCWSCYMSYDNILKNTVDLDGDFYLRIKLNNIIGGVYNEGEQTTDYTTQLSSDFQLTSCDTQSSNVYNPYANLDAAVNLQTQLTETISCMFGIPIYYFKLKPDIGSKDITFKEYALMNVDSVKQIKLIITDNTMPSSKPEFTDLGLEFQTDWETEISKVTFATAFGNTVQPTEGDLIYIPMMKRMWMVNQAYEEKNGSLMWNATTFKVMLVKYQEKGSVDLKDTEEMVNTFVKNKYEDLFGDDNNSTYDSSEAALESPVSAANSLYPVYESDAIRKYITCDTVSFGDISTYFKGTLISDSSYVYLRNDIESKIIYQQKYCGNSAAISFLIKPDIVANFEGIICKVGNCEINIKQKMMESEISTNIYPDSKLTLTNGSIYFIVIRWDENMNLFDMSAYLYTYNESIPQYKLQPAHYYYDIDNPSSQISLPYSIELTDEIGHDIYLSNFFGIITNFKVFDIYNDNISELLQMYPTHQHLMINDTARRINGLNGVLMK